MSDLVLEETTAIAARFRLHLRCEHCVEESTLELDVPAVEDAPTDIEELLESAFLQRQRFVCKDCDYPIGMITGVARLRVPEASHA